MIKPEVTPVGSSPPAERADSSPPAERAGEPNPEPSAQVRPLHAILQAFEGGAGTLAEVQRLTALSDDVVRAGVDHLVRLGRLDAKELANGCPSGGCGSCASGTADGRAGCGSAGPSANRTGPVLVALSLKRPS